MLTCQSKELSREARQEKKRGGGGSGGPQHAIFKKRKVEMDAAKKRAGGES
jgi:hypothetical protein